MRLKDLDNSHFRDYFKSILPKHYSLIWKAERCVQTESDGNPVFSSAADWTQKKLQLFASRLSHLPPHLCTFMKEIHKAAG